MKEPRIQYDDREKFPWLVWVGSFLWGKFRGLKGARNAVRRLNELLEEVGVI